MAVQSEIFSTEYGVRSFISTKHIATKQHMSVWLQRRSDNIWFQLSTSNYELINNSAVLTQAPNSTIYSQVEIRVADTPDELGSSQSEIAVLAGLYDEIVALNGIKNDITTVAGISVDVTTVSSNILDINSVVTNIVPNLTEILQADTNATTATTKATEASASATSALNSATTATNQAIIATDEAIIATTKASEASASATSASSSAASATTKANEASASAGSASASATTATTQAGIATTQAGIATTKAGEASTSASQALGYRNEALGYRNEAEASALSVDSANLVHITGDETIAGVKTFSSFPITPSSAPTTDYQVANKLYVDGKVVATPDATETIKGKVELATIAEVQAGTDTVRAVTPAGMKASVLGLGQTWQNVTSSRAAGTTYTNTTGKPIMVHISTQSAASSNSTSINLNGVSKSLGDASSSILHITASVVIPHEHTYSIVLTGSAAISSWLELR